jgi:hypothetical protein
VLWVGFYIFRNRNRIFLKFQIRLYSIGTLYEESTVTVCEGVYNLYVHNSLMYIMALMTVMSVVSMIALVTLMSVGSVTRDGLGEGHLVIYKVTSLQARLFTCIISPHGFSSCSA